MLSFACRFSLIRSFRTSANLFSLLVARLSFTRRPLPFPTPLRLTLQRECRRKACQVDRSEDWREYLQTNADGELPGLGRADRVAGDLAARGGPRLDSCEMMD